MKLDRKKLVNCKDEDKCLWGTSDLDIVENCLKCKRNDKCENPTEDFIKRLKKVGY